MIVAKVTPEQYAELGQKLAQEEGILLYGNAGTLTKNGVTAIYTYDGAGTLHIEVTSKPFLVSRGFCEQKIREALQEQGVVCS